MGALSGVIASSVNSNLPNKLESIDWSGFMRENVFDFLIHHFSSYQIEFSKNGTLAEIINPFGIDNIRVEYVPDDEFTPFIVYFAFQHCHMNDEEDIVDYICDLIDGNRCCIEFFKNGTRHFGGDISAEELINLSYEGLEQYSGYFGLHKLINLADSFKVRGWNPKDNFDADFIISDNGSVEIMRQE